MDHPKLEEWKTVWRERRSVTMVYILLRISVVLVMLAQIFNGNFENVFLCVLTLILFMMPSVLEKKLDITLPNTLEIIILLFIYAAEQRQDRKKNHRCNQQDSAFVKQFLAARNVQKRRFLVVFSTHCSGLTLCHTLRALWHKQDSTLVAEQTTIFSVYIFFASIYSIQSRGQGCHQE